MSLFWLEDTKHDYPLVAAQRVNRINVRKAENCTNPFLDGHKAGELGQDGELFA